MPAFWTKINRGRRLHLDNFTNIDLERCDKLL